MDICDEKLSFIDENASVCMIQKQRLPILEMGIGLAIFWKSVGGLWASKGRGKKMEDFTGPVVWEGGGVGVRGRFSHPPQSRQIDGGHK
jgi:hypothetical protein